jgi:transcription initiation factor TFIID subunit TAF12
VSGTAAEFAVAIRSVLVQPQDQPQQQQQQQQQPEQQQQQQPDAASSSMQGSQPAAQPPGGAGARAAAAGGGSGEAVPVHKVFLYAGVGVVRGSDPESEWQELALKCRQ